MSDNLLLLSNWPRVKGYMADVILASCREYQRRNAWIGNGHHFAQNLWTDIEQKLKIEGFDLTYLPYFHSLEALIAENKRIGSFHEGAFVQRTQSILKGESWNSLLSEFYQGICRVSESALVERQSIVDWDPLAAQILDSATKAVRARVKDAACLNAWQRVEMENQLYLQDIQIERIRQLWDASFVA